MRMLLVAPIKDSSGGMAQYPPMGLGYLATALKKAGHEPVILDCVLEGLDFNNFKEYISKHRFDVVGFNVFSLALKEVKKSLSIVKETVHDTITMVGGPHVSAVPEHALTFLPEADYGFKGEAEIGLPQLLTALEKKEFNKFSEIPGLIWRNGGKVCVNSQTYINNLDELGFPDWELIKLDRYYRYGTSITKDSAPVISTRGCPFRCNFCSAWISAGRKIRRRSIEHIMQEMD